jgi:hypothetical protein
MKESAVNPDEGAVDMAQGPRAEPPPFDPDTELIDTSYGHARERRRYQKAADALREKVRQRRADR